MRTAITEMLGIDVPILAFTHCRDVVAALPAGGMGVLGAVAHSPEQLEVDLDWIEAQVGSRPYGVDVIVPAKYAGSDAGGYTLADIAQLIPPSTSLSSRTSSGAMTCRRSRGRGGSPRPDGPRQRHGCPFSESQAGPLLDVALAHAPSSW